jgi:peroxiredoxin Q/BCP
MSVETGQKAPVFDLPDQDGNQVSLASFRGKQNVVLAFYPADFTPVCTREACLFRDNYGELAAAGVNLAGVSADDSESHARFRDRHHLLYPLLADPAKRTIRAFGVAGPLGIGLRRASFLIDRDKVIRAAVRADLRLKPHARLIKQALSMAGSAEHPD